MFGAANIAVQNLRHTDFNHHRAKPAAVDGCPAALQRGDYNVSLKLHVRFTSLTTGLIKGLTIEKSKGRERTEPGIEIEGAL